MKTDRTKLPDGIEAFIHLNRKITWEAEFENGHYCIGENKVREFFEKFIVPELHSLTEKEAEIERLKLECAHDNAENIALRESNRELVEALNKIHWLEPETHDEWGEAAAYTQVKKIAEEALSKSQTP